MTMYIPGRDLYDPLKLFVSYSPEDAKMKDHLETHLHVLFTCGRARPDIWAQDRIPPGSDKREVTSAAIERSDLALLLISASYLASPFINDVELPALIQRQKMNGLVVIPIILRSCLWREHPQLREMAPIPTDGTSIAGRDRDARDEQYMLVASVIAAEFERRQNDQADPISSGALLLPSPGRVRLVHIATPAYSPREEASLPDLVDGLDAALRIAPQAMFVNPRWRELSLLPMGTPWMGPKPDGWGGITVTHKVTGTIVPGDFRANLSKNYDTRLWEYIDHEKCQAQTPQRHYQPMLSANNLVLRLATFVVFARTALRTAVGQLARHEFAIKFKWSLHEAAGAMCHCPGWAEVPSAVGNLPVDIAEAPLNLTGLSTKKYLFDDDSTASIIDIVTRATRELLFPFEVYPNRTSGRLRPPTQTVTKLVQQLLSECSSIGLNRGTIARD